MSKPGEMVQILREDYEEQLEAYRILRNKFLIAVPGMDLDKEKQLYDQWKLDLHLNSIISFDRAIPTEPRTCETCARGCLPNERVYVNPDAEDPCPGWTHRSPQSADVETVREAEKSYCIERVGANLYWGGSPMTGKYKGLDALVSISAAIRFARKEDAEMVRASQGMSSDEYVVTEHQWL